MTPTLHGTQVTLRPVVPDDVEILAKILSEPEVRRWWGQYDAERVRHEFVGGGESTCVLAVELDGEVVGSAQFYEETTPDYRHAGIDVFVHPAYHGRGIGSDTVRTVARYLIHSRGHHRLVIDPRSDNDRAIACYERVGFRKVGLMRSYERGPDGEWHDCYMMEALKGEIS